MRRIAKVGKRFFSIFLVMTICMVLLDEGSRVAAATKKTIFIEKGTTKKLLTVTTKKVKKIQIKSDKKGVIKTKIQKKGKKRILSISAKKPGRATIQVKVIPRGNKKEKTIKYTIYVENANTSTGTTIPTAQPSATPYQPKYSYDLKVVNKGALYVGLPVYLYIKTDNPAWDVTNPTSDYYSLNLEGNDVGYGGTYNDLSDVHYMDNVISSTRVVEGGYLIAIGFNTPGTHTITLQEYHSESSYNSWNDVVSLTITVNDYVAEEEAWYQQVMSEQTTAGMTPNEKLVALMMYVKRNFTYDQSKPEYGAVRLLDVCGTPYWIHKHIDCWDATAIMCRFADMLGLKSESTYAGYLMHTYTTVYIDGVEHTYDACPYVETGYISEWDYVL